MAKMFDFYFDETTESSTEDVTTTTSGEDVGVGEASASKDGDKKYTDADLDRIIGERFKKWQRQQEKRIDEAKKLAEMSAQERAEHERDALQTELNELKAKNARAEMEKTARGMLASDGINIPDSLIASLVRDEAEETARAVKEFANAYKSAVATGVTAQLAHKQPAGTSAGTLTKADIMKVADPLKRQKLIKENISLFR